MPGAREIGLVGTALVLTGGVACAVCYLMTKTQKHKKTVNEELNEDGSRKEHVRKATKTETALKTPIISEVCGFWYSLIHLDIILFQFF